MGNAQSIQNENASRRTLANAKKKKKKKKGEAETE
jgi:hypothetical protein